MAQLYPHKAKENAVSLLETARSARKQGGGQSWKRDPVARRLKLRARRLVSSREAKDAIAALFDDPRYIGNCVAALWSGVNELVHESIAQGLWHTWCQCRQADPDREPTPGCRVCEGEGWVIDIDRLTRCLQAQMREGRGLVALGLVSESAVAGAAINITIPITADPNAEDPGDGDEITVS